MTEITINRAALDDLMAIDRLSLRGFVEGQGVIPPYDRGAMLKGMIDLIESGLIIVAREQLEDGRVRVVGALAMQVSHAPFSPNAPFLDVMHFYVLPDYRARSADGMPVGTAMIRAAKYLAASAGARLFFRFAFNESMEEKGLLMEREGFTFVGGNYIIDPHPQASEAQAEAADKAA